MHETKKIQAANERRVRMAILANVARTFGQAAADRAANNPAYLRQLQLDLGKRR